MRTSPSATSRSLAGTWWGIWRLFTFQRNLLGKSRTVRALNTSEERRLVAVTWDGVLCSSVWSPGPVANQLSASLTDLVCTNNNNKASVQVLAKLSLQGYITCGEKPQICCLSATYSTLLLLFNACSWGASQSQISKGKKMFYGSLPQSC